MTLVVAGIRLDVVGDSVEEDDESAADHQEECDDEKDGDGVEENEEEVDIDAIIASTLADERVAKGARRSPRLVQSAQVMQDHSIARAIENVDLRNATS